MPVRLALQCRQHRVGRRLLTDQHDARLRREARSDDLAFLFGTGEIAGRIDDRSECCGGVDVGASACGGERLEARRDRDLVVVGEPLFDDRVLGHPERQHAEPTRRQPQQRRAALDAALLEGGVEAGTDEAPQGRAEAIDRIEPFGPALRLFRALKVVDEVSGDPAGRLLARWTNEQLRESCRRQVGEVDDGDVAVANGCRHHDQLAAVLGDDGDSDGAAGRCNPARFRERDLARFVARATVLHEREQSLALRWRASRGRRCGPYRSRIRPFSGRCGSQPADHSRRRR